MLRKLCSLFLALAVAWGQLALPGVARAQAVVVSLQPAHTVVGTGQAFTIAIQVDGVTGLAGYELELAFDPAVLTLIDPDGGGAEGDGVGGAEAVAAQLAAGSVFAGQSPLVYVNTGNDPAGSARYGALVTAADEAFTGSGTLAVADFKAVGAGSAAVQLKSDSGVGSGGLVLGAWGSDPIPYGPVGAVTITVLNEMPLSLATPPEAAAVAEVEGVTAWHTNQANLTVSGSTHPGALLTLEMGGAAPTPVAVDGEGHFTTLLSLDEGTTTVRWTAAVDAVPPRSITRTVVKDTVPPGVTTATVSPTSTTDATTVSFTLTEAARVVIEYSRDGGAWTAGYSSGSTFLSGQVSRSISLPALGSYSFRIALTDRAANTQLIGLNQTVGRTSPPGGGAPPPSDSPPPGGGGGVFIPIPPPTRVTEPLVPDVTVQRAQSAVATASLSGSAGGSVATPEGSITVRLPAGAAAEELLVSILPHEDAIEAAAGFELVSAATVTATDAASSRAVTAFHRPLSLTFRFPAAAVSDPARLGVHYWNTGLEVWVPLPTVVNASARTVTATTDHLTLFAVMADTLDLAPVLDPLPATAEAATFFVSGRAAAGATVQLSRNDRLTAGPVTPGSDGRFTLSVGLAEGANRILALAHGDGFRRASQEALITYTPAPPAPRQPVGEAPVIPLQPVQTVPVPPVPPVPPVALVPPAAPPPLLTDIDGHWAEADIRALAASGVVQGFEDGTFRPELQVTRAQFALLMARVLGLTLQPVEDGDAPGGFADAHQIPTWAGEAIAAMVGQALISGYDDNTFRPDRPISRTEVAVLVTRALAYKSVPVAPSGGLRFTDSARIPAWASEPVGAAVAAGLVGGFPDGSFQPDQRATRAQAVVIIRRLQAALAGAGVRPRTVTGAAPSPVMQVDAGAK